MKEKQLKTSIDFIYEKMKEFRRRINNPNPFSGNICESVKAYKDLTEALVNLETLKSINIIPMSEEPTTHSIKIDPIRTVPKHKRVKGLHFTGNDGSCNRRINIKFNPMKVEIQGKKTSGWIYEDGELIITVPIFDDQTIDIKNFDENEEEPHLVKADPDMTDWDNPPEQEKMFKPLKKMCPQCNIPGIWQKKNKFHLCIECGRNLDHPENQKRSK